MVIQKPYMYWHLWVVVWYFACGVMSLFKFDVSGLDRTTPREIRNDTFWLANILSLIDWCRLKILWVMQIHRPIHGIEHQEQEWEDKPANIVQQLGLVLISKVEQWGMLLCGYLSFLLEVVIIWMNKRMPLCCLKKLKTIQQTYPWLQSRVISN